MAKEFNHYFVNKTHEESDFFTFSTEFLGKKYLIHSCSDVFSKNELDYGSLVLVKTLIKQNGIRGNVLDICCGYGTIGMLLAENIDLDIDMCDINSTAVGLAQQNVKENGIKVGEIFESDMFSSVKKKYDHIVSNPPIKTGKKLLLEFADESYEHLNTNGTLSVVIKKNLGADSFKKYLVSLFGNCEVLERDRGYYILQAKKLRWFYIKIVASYWYEPRKVFWLLVINLYLPLFLLYNYMFFN